MRIWIDTRSVSRVTPSDHLITINFIDQCYGYVPLRLVQWTQKDYPIFSHHGSTPHASKRRWWRRAGGKGGEGQSDSEQETWRDSESDGRMEAAGREIWREEGFI